MGAVVTITWDNSDPNHTSIIQQLAKSIEASVGEPVSVDVGITDNRSAPNVIEMGRIVGSERLKIR